MSKNPHRHYTSQREKILEHKFLADVLEYLWCARKIYTVEVSKVEVDSYGYDVIITVNKKTRYIQLKASLRHISKWPVQKALWEYKTKAFVILQHIEEDNIEGYFKVKKYYVGRLGKIPKKKYKNRPNTLTFDFKKNTGKPCNNIGEVIKVLWGI